MRALRGLMLVAWLDGAVALVAPRAASVARLTCGPRSPPRLLAKYPDEYEPDMVEKLFGFFFGEKEDTPFGLKRVTRDSAPETWKATTTEFAEAVKGDPREAAFIRPLMARTSLERRKLKVVYDAGRDGWRAEAFHGKVDGTGPAVVYAKTQGGAIVGGYNPKGWAGYGEYRNSIAAFLFHFPPGVKNAKEAFKLPKVGSAGLSVIDAPETGPRFGPDGLYVEMSRDKPRQAISRLGNAFQKLPNGGLSVFGREGGRTELRELKVLAGVYGSGEVIPYRDALPGQLG